jgi:hypothetical protein
VNSFKDKYNFLLIISGPIMVLIILAFGSLGFPKIENLLADILMPIYGGMLFFYGFYFGFIKKDISVFFTTRTLKGVKSHRADFKGTRSFLAGIFYILTGIGFALGVILL